MEGLKIDNYISSKLPDDVVVQRVLNGEKELYEILLRRYNQTLYRAIRSYLQNDRDVEDTMQDTYIKAYQKLYQFKGDAKFSSWLIRIGINEALMKIRKQKKKQDLSTNDENFDTILQLPNLNQMNPEEQVINHEIRFLIEKAIDNLPEKYRIVYTLREVEGMSNTEICASLEISASNVKVRFHRAKHLLREALFKISTEASVFEFGNSRCDKITDYVMKNI